MKRITLFFAVFCIFTLCTKNASIYAQDNLTNLNTTENTFSEEDVVFFVGEGDQTAYIMIDFRDGTADASFTWGVNFEDEENLTVVDALDLLQAAQESFYYEETGGFLNDIIYNHHEGLDSMPDWWSTWSGDSIDGMAMDGGISANLVDGNWYGLSYGFMPTAEMPQFVYAAYDENWFGFDDIEEWFGEGENQTIITIDFVKDEDEEEVTFAWGLNFDEETISAKEALEALANLDADLEIIYNEEDEITAVSYLDLEKEISSSEDWFSFIGNNMSDYQPAEDGILEELEDQKMFGISFGESTVRRPYIPVSVNPETTPEEVEFDEEDVVFYVGEGEKTAYFVVDFRDGTTDASFTWGVNFEDNDLDLFDALLMIEEEDENFTVSGTYYEAQDSYFLDDIIYNHHEGIAGEPDYWSSWTGNSLNDFSSNMGTGEDLEDGKWYGFSYGFDPAPEIPEFVYAAYDESWFGFEDVDSWFGEGENQTIITIDFVEDEDAEEVTFAWGLNFEEETISGKNALETLADLDEDLSLIFDENDEILTVQYKDLERTITAEESWKSFIGNNMSDYVLAENGILEMIADREMFGISFGGEKVRRPYIPTLVENPDMGVDQFEKEAQVKIWPNPTVDVLQITSTAEIQKVQVFDLQGRKVLEGNQKELNVENLSSGNYLLQIKSDQNIITKQLIKQ